jgi:hypothetical protein
MPISKSTQSSTPATFPSSLSFALLQDSSGNLYTGVCYAAALGPPNTANGDTLQFVTPTTPLPINQCGDTLATGQVSVGSSATLIAGARPGRRSLTVVMLGGGTDVYLGVSGVTTGTGTLLLGVKGAAYDLPTTAAVYGVVGSGSANVSFHEVY